MKIALLADLHGNADALREVEKELALAAPDELWFLGDAVGKGPDNDVCFDWVRANCQKWIAGNWDRGVGLRLFPGDGIYQRQLGEERLKHFLNLPIEETVWFSGLRVRLMHGRPVLQELPIGTEPADALEPMFTDQAGEKCDAVIYADMHRQLLRTMRFGTLYNIGSVGNATGVKGAFFGILEGEPGEKEAPFSLRLCRVPFDPEPVIERARLFFGEDDHRYTSFAHELRTGQYVPRGVGTPPKNFG